MNGSPATLSPEQALAEIRRRISEGDPDNQLYNMALGVAKKHVVAAAEEEGVDLDVEEPETGLESDDEQAVRLTAEEWLTERGILRHHEMVRGG